MLNSQPLNSGPLNSIGSTAEAPPPVAIDPGSSFVWRHQIMLDGVDVSGLLTGGVRIEYSEDGDAVASFALWLGEEPVNVAAYTGAGISIDFIVMGEQEFVSRRFTGYLVQPEFDVLSRVLSCEATTRLQDRLEAMELSDIDLFVGGLWSEDVFEEVAGRSRWEYAQERMSTRAASLNVDRMGQPRITSWRPAIAYEFGPGSTIYQSTDVGLSSLSETTNIIELELDYRFTRYRQRNQRYSWQHPGISGNTSIIGFNGWRADSSELPDVQMIVEATESAGWYLHSPVWFRLPGDLPNLPQPWYNQNTDLLLAAAWTASIRWSQRAVEQYRVRLEVSAAVDAVGPVIKRDRIVLDTDTDTDRLWDAGRASQPDNADPETPITQLPRRSQARLTAAFNCAVAIKRAELLSAHRGNIVSWQVPLAHALAVDLGQGLRLNDLSDVTGTVAMLTEETDIETGSALLTISIAVSAGEAGAVSDQITMPAPPTFSDDAGPVVPSMLPTQLGLRTTSPPYDEELPGFAGNYSVGNGAPEDRYPRRMMINTPEIPEQWRNEITAERAITIRIAPPADTLEI